MALTYIPRRQNPFQSQLPGFLQNLMFNQMAAKRQDEQLEDQTIAAQGKEARGYQAKGWREAPKGRNTIKVGDKYYVPPTKGFEIQTVDGKQVLANTITPLGGKPQVQNASVLKSDKDEKLWMHNPKLKRKQQVSPNEIARLAKAGWVMGQPYGSQSQTSLTVGPDGKVQFVQGGVDGATTAPLTKTNLSKVQQEVMSNDDQIAEVKSIMDTYKQDYTNKWFRLGKSYDQFKESWDFGKPPSPQEQKELGEYSVWRQNTAKNAIETFHKFAGSNMTKTEIKHTAPTIPIAGDKWYNGDSHSVFTSKLSNLYKTMSITNARKKYLLRQGYDQKQYDGMLEKEQIMTLANFENKVDDAAVAKRKELTQKAKAAGLDLTDVNVHKRIRNAVFTFLNQEWGLSLDVTP